MGNEFKKAFQSISEIEPPKKLRGLILRRIELEKNKKIKTNLMLSYVGFFGSLLIAIESAILFGSSFIKSDFWSMLSLIFSDVLIVAKNWNEYLFSLMETFPVANLIAILTPIFMLLVSLNFCFYLSKKIAERKHYLEKLNWAN